MAQSCKRYYRLPAAKHVSTVRGAVGDMNSKRCNTWQHNAASGHDTASNCPAISWRTPYRNDLCMTETLHKHFTGPKDLLAGLCVVSCSCEQEYINTIQHGLR